MTRRAQLAVLLAVALLVILALWPEPAAGDVPIVARVNALFLPVRDAGPLSGTLQPRRPVPVRTSLTGALSPSVRAGSSSVAPVRATSRPLGLGSAASKTGQPASDPVRDARTGGVGAPNTSERTPIPSVRDTRWRPPSGAPTSRAGATEPSAGIASWFRSPAGVSAAGPALRTPGWRGSVVRVTGPAGSALTKLGDFCRCFAGTADERAIDLDAPVFVRVCGPLSKGLCHVVIEREP